MQAKKIVSLVLLLFVGASVLYLMLKETGVAPEEAVTVADLELPQSGRVVTATYFHGNTRCITCNKLETYSQEAIDTHLSMQIENGRLIWQAINYEESPNEHFVDDYELAYQSLVLQEYVDGKPGEFVNLDSIWALVGDEEAFVEYVAKGITTFVEQP